MNKSQHFILFAFLLTVHFCLSVGLAFSDDRRVLLVDSRQRDIEEDVKKTVRDYEDEIKDEEMEKEELQKFLNEEMNKSDDEPEIESLDSKPKVKK